MGDYAAAILKYEESLTIDDRYAGAYLSLGDVYLVTGDLDRAEAAYRQAAEIDPSASVSGHKLRIYLMLGDEHLAAGDLEEAQGFYLQAVEIDPAIPEVHSVLSYIYGKQGRYDEAVSATLQVLALPGNERLLYSTYKNLSIFYQELGRLDEAMVAAQEALARAPESERAGMEQLIAALSDGGAIPQTETMVQQYLAEGEAALSSGDWTRADEAYNRALSLNPNLIVAHSALAFVYAQQGRLEEAEQENQIVLAAIPGDYATLKNLAIISRQLGRYEESLSYARQALESPRAVPEEKTQLEMFIAEIQSLLD
jgi:tetratricopeptide (TPR) repeat protein